MKLVLKVEKDEKRTLYFGQTPLFEYCPKKYFRFFPKTDEQILLDKIIRKVGKKYDSIFYLRAGLGEAYIFYLMIEEYIKRHNFKRPCIVCHRKFYSELTKMFVPQIPFYHVDLPQDVVNRTLKNRNFEYRGITFNVNPSTLREILVVWDKYRAKTENRHYIDVLKELNSISNLTLKRPIITSKDKQKALRKAKKIKLNLDNFIFLIPEANFFCLLDDSIWENIRNQLKLKGYDIFVNTTEFTVQEAYYLATLSKGIIGVRGGFSEILSTVDVPKHIIYTKNIAKVIESLNIFTLKKYPLVNKETLFEYECFGDDQGAIAESILKNI